MRKFLLSLFIFVLSLNQMVAQRTTFKKGDMVLNVGIGFGSSNYSSFYTSNTPALTASFEVDVKDGIIEKGSIGVGGYLGFSSAKFDPYWKTTNIMMGARGSFHYPLAKKLDTYTGLILGYNFYDTQYYDTYYGAYGASSSGMTLAWFAGGRYYFNEYFAGMAEIGFGVPYLTLGVAFKF